MAGEGLWDLLTEFYSLSYIRLMGDHLPVARYNDPGATIMIAITGFEDRDMINCALRYRYVMSFEPYNFKGNVDDFPSSMTYGRLMDEFRRRYRAYVWDGEFRDDQDAVVIVRRKALQRVFSICSRGWETGSRGRERGQAGHHRNSAI